MRAWTWLKDHALALVSVFAAIATAIAYWQFQRRRVGSLKDAVVVEKARTKIAKATAEKEMHKASAEDTGLQEAKLDDEIAAEKRKVVAITSYVERMSDDEVAAEFDRLYR